MFIKGLNLKGHFVLDVKIAPASNLLHFWRHVEQPGTPKSTRDHNEMKM